MSVKVCGVIFLLLFSLVNAQFPREVVIDTSINFIRNTPSHSIEEARLVHSMREKEWKRGEYNQEWDFYMMFRVVHKDMIPFWKNVVKEHSHNTLMQLWFINALTRLGDRKQLSLISELQYSENSMIREYLANSYSTLGVVEDIPLLEKWKDTEPNGFVKETLIASIKLIQRGGRYDRIDYLPVLYDLEKPTVTFFYNVKVEDVPEYFWGDYFIDSVDIRDTKEIYYPHQQFAIPIKNGPPAGSFGNDHGYTIHIGEDSGWLLEGLPVHSIADGVVRTVQHNASWGNIIVIESLVDGKPVTHFYGHLAEEVDVLPGDMVYAGKKIGVIGRSVSYENGGYWAHVHLGVEKSSYEYSSIVGYSETIGNFISIYDVMSMKTKSGDIVDLQ